MGSCYKMLRPVNDDDLDKADPDVATILKKLPPEGHLDASRMEPRGRDALAWACSRGIMRRTDSGDCMMRFESVKFWIAQLNSPGAKNIRIRRGTRQSYAAALGTFDEWLRGRKFPVTRDGAGGGGDGKAGNAEASFSDVGEMLRFCQNSIHGARAAKRVVREYLAHLASAGYSKSTATVRCSAIKSYFAVHDVPVDVKVGKFRYAQDNGNPELSLSDFYKMVYSGSMGPMMRAITLVKFQAGLDSSTLADRFNFEAYPQIVRHFGVEDYDSWDLDKCPVPIKLTRLKTGMPYTTFIDRDAVSQLRDYLRWKESRHGKHDGTGPLFVTRRGTPVSPIWISVRFSKAASDAGVQKKFSRGYYRVRAHEVRDLLKSTLVAAGCAQYAADHVLGHAPKDSYEKQATLYPEALRREYSKASGYLNVFTSFERYLEMVSGPPREGAGGGGGGGGGQPATMQQQQQQQQPQDAQAAFQGMASAMSGMARIMLQSPDVPDDLARVLRDLEGIGGRDGKQG